MFLDIGGFGVFFGIPKKLRAVYNDQVDDELKYAATETDAPTPLTIRAIARRIKNKAAVVKVSCVVYDTTSRFLILCCICF